MRKPASILPRPIYRPGTVLIYTTTAMVAMSALVSLTVDYGRVQLAKTEIQSAAMAAARAGGASLSSGTSAARTAAINAAAANTVDGQALVLQSSDVVVGKWDSSTLTLDTSSPSPDTVQVTAHRDATRGNPVPMIFAKVFGFSACSLTATTSAKATGGTVGGIIGLSGITANNNIYVASYDSTVRTNPNHSHKNDNGALGSNGTITANSGTLYGDAILGPSASITGISVTGSSAHQTGNIAAPAAASWSPGTNPGGISQNYTAGGGTTTLAGGTYWFTSLTINGTLKFSGATTIYLNGDADISGNLYAYNDVPANLKIYQIGSRTFGDSSTNGIDVIADIEAPSSALQAKNNLTFKGRMIFDTITVKNGADFYYDEQLGSASGVTTISTVK